MKAYLLTTSLVFGLITAAHLFRIVQEGTRLLREPWFMLLTLFAAALCAWSARLLVATRRTGR